MNDETSRRRYSAGASLPVFLSSTFRDFHQERDLIHSTLLPQLRARTEDLGLLVDFVDLRWGVPTAGLDEVERTQSVLTVCAAEIDRCNGLVVGLVGDYLGWVPESSAVSEFLPDLPRVDRSSITELEIRYAFHKISIPPVVLIRSIERSPDASVGPHARSDPAAVEAFHRYCSANAQVYRYTAAEGPDGRLHLDDFERTFLDAVEMYIRGNLVSAPSHEPSAGHGGLAGREDELVNLASLVASAERGVVVVAPSGTGKSALLGALRSTSLPQWPSIFGHEIGPGRQTELDVIAGLEEHLGLPATAGDMETRLAAVTAKSIGLPPTLLLIDAIDQLWPLDARDRLWLLQRLPPNIRPVVTTTSHVQADLLRDAGYDLFRLDSMSGNSARSAAMATAESHGRRLHPEVTEALAARPRTGLWISLAVNILCSVTEEFFVRAAPGGDTSIAEALTEIALGLPDDQALLVEEKMRSVASLPQHANYEKYLLGVLTSPPGSLPESVVATYVGVAPLDAAAIRHSYSGIIGGSPDTGLTIDHRAVESALLDHFGDRLDATHLDLLELFLGRGDAWPEQVVHHALHTSSWELAVRMTAAHPDRCYDVIRQFLVKADETGIDGLMAELSRSQDVSVLRAFIPLLSSFQYRILAPPVLRGLAESLRSIAASLGPEHADPYLLSDAYSGVADVYRSLGESTASADAANQAVEMLAPLYRSDPRRSGLAFVRVNVRYIESAVGNLDRPVFKRAGVLENVKSTLAHLETFDGSEEIEDLRRRCWNVQARIGLRSDDALTRVAAANARRKLIESTRLETMMDPSESNKLALAEALLTPNDVASVATYRVECDEALDLCRELRGRDVRSARYALGLARAHHHLALALEHDFHADEQMRSHMFDAAAIVRRTFDLHEAYGEDNAVLAGVLIDLGIIFISHRRSAREHWMKDIGEGIGLLEAALAVARQPSSSGDLRKAIGQSIAGYFPELLERHGAGDLAIPLPGVMSVLPGISVGHDVSAWNRLLAVWSAAELAAEGQTLRSEEYSAISSHADRHRHAAELRTRNRERDRSLSPEFKRARTLSNLKEALIAWAVVAALVYWPGRWLFRLVTGWL